MNDMIERLRTAERDAHVIWTEHCAGAACKERHKRKWQEITDLLSLVTQKLVDGDLIEVQEGC